MDNNTFAPFICCNPRPQRHVHEFLGSVRLAEPGEDAHNHRFAGVSEQAIPIGDGRHVHNICTKTDFYEDHFHFIGVTSEPNVELDENRHVHFVKGNTNVEDGHRHEFILATLIENPIGD